MTTSNEPLIKNEENTFSMFINKVIYRNYDDLYTLIYNLTDKYLSKIFGDIKWLKIDSLAISAQPKVYRTVYFWYKHFLRERSLLVKENIDWDELSEYDITDTLFYDYYPPLKVFARYVGKLSGEFGNYDRLSGSYIEACTQEYNLELVKYAYNLCLVKVEKEKKME